MNEVQYPDMAKVGRYTAMVALCAYRDVIPARWREDVSLHRKAIRAWARQFGRVYEGRRAA